LLISEAPLEFILRVHTADDNIKECVDLAGDTQFRSLPSQIMELSCLNSVGKELELLYKGASGVGTKFGVGKVMIFGNTAPYFEGKSDLINVS